MPSEDPFYAINEDKDTLSLYPAGTILRKRPICLSECPGLQTNNLICWQMAFTSRGPFQDAQNAVATVIIPPNAEKRDKIVIQSPKASGAQPGCRTSFFLNKDNGSFFGATSELFFATDYLRRGFIVVVSDVQGQFDAFGSGPTAGHVVLDTIRAVLSFQELRLATIEDVRIVPWGYSAGGMATLWAAYFLESYAPELQQNIVAWSVGAAPTNLRETALSVNNSIAAGLIIGVLQGLSNIYPELSQFLQENMNKRGKVELNKARTGCFYEFMPSNMCANVLGVQDNQGVNRTGYFVTQDPLDQPIPKKVLNGNLLDIHSSIKGKNAEAPMAPIFVYHSIADRVAPIQEMDTLLEYWGTNGATIKYDRLKVWEHVSGAFAAHSQNLQWISSRLERRPLEIPSGRLTVADVNTLIDDEESKIILGSDRAQALARFYRNKYLRKSRPWF